MFSLLMKNAITLYLTVSILALVLKYTFKYVSRLWGKNHAHTHEKDHQISDNIKLIILILLAVVLWYIATLPNNADSDMSTVSLLVPENKPNDNGSIYEVNQSNSNYYQYTSFIILGYFSL